MNIKQELCEHIEAIGILVKENPCRIGEKSMLGILLALKFLLGDKWCKGGSRDRVAAYLKRDPRTIIRWNNQFDDFPKPRHDGQRSTTYNWLEVIRWRLKHNDLY